METQPYPGSRQRLILAIDVGTTFSGVSYCHLVPDEIPKIRMVNRFSGQSYYASDSRVPSILLYSRIDGSVLAAGAECRAYEDMPEPVPFEKVIWFKLHLRPNGNSDDMAAPLPVGKRPVDVLADFLGYLLNCTKTFITESFRARGGSIWNLFQNDPHLILAHPNGWRGPEQAVYREAVVQAGFMSEDRARRRLEFVTEGEASLHFCISQDFQIDPSPTVGTLILDAGGGSVDFSAYSTLPDSQLSTDLQACEIVMPLSSFKGSIWVTEEARIYLAKNLKDFSAYTSIILEHFENRIKYSFNARKLSASIQFGTAADHNPRAGISYGSLLLSGETIAGFFKPIVDQIIELAWDQIDDATSDIKTVFVVGGFASNDYLFTQLKDAFEGLDIKVFRPGTSDCRGDKAVAYGAISFFLNRFVTARTVKDTIGIRINVKYDEEDPRHQDRVDEGFFSSSGEFLLPGGFDVIVKKDTLVTSKKFYSRGYSEIVPVSCRDELREISVDIEQYVGNHDDPLWIDKEPRKFVKLATVVADTSHVAQRLATMRVHDGKEYEWLEMPFKILFQFGDTEMKAYLSWDENGEEKRSDAKIVYN